MLLPSDGISKRRLKSIRIGCGPSLYETYCIASKASEIVLSDYSSSNRDALRLWLNNDERAFNWFPLFVRTAKDLEGKGQSTVFRRMEKIRRAVKAVVHCDLTQDPPIQSGFDYHYDVVSSSFCVCVATKTHEEYREGIGKLSKLVKPGGVLMISDCEHDTCHLSSYSVNEYRQLPYVAITSDFVVRAFNDAGIFKASVRSIELNSEHPFRVQRPERTGYFHVKGVKRE